MKTIEQRAGEYAHETEVKNGFDMHPKTASFQGYYQGFSDCQQEYEEKLRWIPISEKKPEPRKDISLKLENLSNSEITGFMGYSGEFYIKLTYIIDCDNVKLKCRVTHWRYFL